MSKKIAVIDMNHGGIPISQKLSKIGFSVTAIDVYDKLGLKIISNLNKDYGVDVIKKPIAVDEFDFIVAPLHLNPNYAMLKSAREKDKKIISHHEIVGIILSNDERIKNIKFIEISGTKAKTSTAFILANIISQKFCVILHTSYGLIYIKNGKSIQIDKLSITPGNILQVIDRTICFSPTFYIFEVSIGFTGYSDFNILTTLNNDVLIAANSKYESDAILQTMHNIKNSTLLINSDIYHRINLNIFECNNTNLITFNENNDVMKMNVQSNYDLNSYRTALSASIAASVELGIEFDVIKSTISKFKGIDGRMLKKNFKGRILIDNSNSGMDVQSVKSAFKFALTFLKNDKKIIFVLGIESKTVCEGLDVEELIKFIEKQRAFIDKLIWVCDSKELKNSNILERFKNIVINTTSSHENGLSIAFNNTKKGDIILSCVKCFR